jgi:hypothetical protein
MFRLLAFALLTVSLVGCIPDRGGNNGGNNGGTSDVGNSDVADDGSTVFDAGSDDTTGPQCLDGELENTECNRCLSQNCCNEIENCFSNDACVGYGSCLQGSDDETTCASQNPGGQSLWDALISCQETRCPGCGPE